MSLPEVLKLVNFFDLVFSLPYFYLTIEQSIQSIFPAKGLLMRNTLSITKVPSQHGVRFASLIYVFKTRAPIHSYGQRPMNLTNAGERSI